MNSQARTIDGRSDLHLPDSPCAAYPETCPELAKVGPGPLSLGWLLAREREVNVMLETDEKTGYVAGIRSLQIFHDAGIPLSKVT